MKIASLGSRVGGGIIDFIIVLVVSGFILFLWGFLLGLSGSEQFLTAEESSILWKGRGMLVGLIVDGAYTIVMMTSDKQATYGQQAVGVKTVKDDGSKLAYDTAIGRWIVSLISSVLLKLGFLVAIFTQNKKTLHDLLAGTVVVTNEENLSTEKEQVHASYEADTYTPQKSHMRVETQELGNDEYLYEQVYEEFHSNKRKKGMYVKLLTHFAGDVEKAEFEYIKLRVNEIKSEKEERRRKIAEEDKDASKQLKLGSYERGSIGGIDCLFFDSGEGAIITIEGKYRVYENYKTLAKSALYYKDTGNYLVTGYIKTIDMNDDIQTKNLTIKCTKCQQKIRIKNMTGMIECPNCEKKWLHEKI